MSFTHLNIHTHYSTLLGLCHIVHPHPKEPNPHHPTLIERAQELGFKNLAITDYGNLFGSQEFFKACTKAEIKPIIGITLNVVPNAKEKARQVGKGSGRLIVLARNLRGYRTLCRLSSFGYIEGFHSRPRVDHSVFEEHVKSGEIVILSGGINSELYNALKEEDFELAKESVDFYRFLTGGEAYFMELSRTGIVEFDNLIPLMEDFARKESIPILATGDVYYVNKDHAYSHKVHRCIGYNKTIYDNDAGFSSDEYYLKSEQEMQELFSDKPQWLSNTNLVADMCEVDFKRDGYHLPNFTPPAKKTLEEHFDEVCKEGLILRYGKNLSKEVLDRYEMERDVITSQGYCTYFLIVADFIAYARSQGIPVGPGRGSAAGSIVAYAMEITDIDPLRFDLLFERFLNASRISMPDIDIDFCQERRKEVIAYVKAKYGEKNVAMIATFGRMGAKAVVRDVGRVLAVDLPIVNSICKTIPDTPGISLTKAQKESPDMREYLQKSKDAQSIIAQANVLEGTVRNIGTHAAGVVISDKDLVEYLPLYQDGDMPSTQFTMTSVEEDCGLLKMDFLGLQNLTVIRHATDLIRENRGIDIDVRKLGLEDPKTFELLQKGETLGVFQFESSGMQTLLKNARPTRFEDIIALLALYRPGPLGSGMDKEFVEVKHGRKEPDYMYPPLCESELKETYGVILYQEQVMRLTSRVAGFSLQDADNLRKAMGKKKLDLMVKFEDRFVDGAINKGVPKDIAKLIWERMAKFAEYGFNKSHSAAYAYVSYETAYLKANFPAEYMAGLMTCDIVKKDKIAVFIEECRRMDIGVLPPHVNDSYFDFRVVGGAIRYGLGGAKGIGSPAVDALVEARKKDGAFTSFDDFITRVDLSRCSKGAIQALIYAGALDDLGANRKQMIFGLDDAMKMAQAEKKKSEQGQMFLFPVEESKASTAHLPNLPEWDESEKLKFEKDVLGFYVSSNPLNVHKNTLSHFSSYRISDLADLDEKTEVCLGGLVTKSSTRFYGDAGKKMFRFSLDDFTGSIECVYFCRENDLYGRLFEDDKIRFIIGEVSRRGGMDTSVRVVGAVAIEEAEYVLAGNLKLHLSQNLLKENILGKLAEILKKNTGSTTVLFMIDSDGGRKIQLKSSSDFSVTLSPKLLSSLAKLLSPERVELSREVRSLLRTRRW